MTQIFDEERTSSFRLLSSKQVPALLLRRKQSKTTDTQHVQLGYGDVEAEEQLNKPMKGHFAKADVACQEVPARNSVLDDC